VYTTLMRAVSTAAASFGHVGFGARTRGDGLVVLLLRHLRSPPSEARSAPGVVWPVTGLRLGALERGLRGAQRGAVAAAVDLVQLLTCFHFACLRRTCVSARCP
jgi:hypothetical protein